MVIHKALRGHQTHDQLFPGHFQGEKGHRAVGILFRHVEGNVQRNGGFTHTGTGGNQQQVRLVETVDFFVQVPEARGKARDVAAGQRQLVEPVVNLQKDSADVLQAFAAAAFPQGENLLFGGFQNVLGRAHAVIDGLGDLAGGGGHIAQQRLVPDDFRVLHDVGSRGGDLHQLHDVGDRRFFVVDAPLFQLVQHRHRVDDLGEVKHGVDGLKNDPVLLLIEVLGPQRADDLGHTAAVN